MLFIVSCEQGGGGSTTTTKKRAKQYIKSAVVVDRSTLRVKFRLYLAEDLESATKWQITPSLKISSLKNIQKWGRKTATYLVKVSPAMEMGVNYKLTIEGLTPKFIDPDKLLNQLYSKKKMGMTIRGNKLNFKIFVPRAEKVKLCLFKKNNLEKPYKEILMKKDSNAVWETTLNGKNRYNFQLYGYRIFGPEAKGGHFDKTKVIADPYGKANAQNNVFPQKSRTVILPASYTTKYRWRSRKWTNLKLRDSIIYEAHVRDLTMHRSSRVPNSIKGSYLGLIKKIPYLKSLGINAIELLPVHDVGNIEPPYRAYGTMANGSKIYNSWNPYSYNHWGYMNSSYFAVESMYGKGATKDPKKWNGVNGSQLKEFKKMVDAFHRQKIAVIMDVVYNHVSQYDYNPLKFIDYDYYFRKVAKSGCGNDFKTERPMARKLIIDSVNYFIKECNIDGFRFDLAGLIDHDTGVAIRKEAMKIHPGVMLIAEPWVGRYCPTEYSAMGWASWNDRFRNGIKGGDGNASGNGGSFIYGKASAESIKKFVTGTLIKNGGLFHKIEHSINYLASHDNSSLGDHIRIDSGRIGPHDQIPGKDVDKIALLNKKEMKINKLAAFMLYTCQGGVLILAGQEWAQAKVVHPPKPAVDTWANGKAKPWTLDHDSYEKDDETNWLNYKHKNMNIDLVNYYAGLARMRTKFAAFRRAKESDISWLPSTNSKALGWIIKKAGTIIVLANGNNSQPATFTLPAGRWKVITNGKMAGTSRLKTASGTITVPPTTGIVLKK